MPFPPRRGLDLVDVGNAVEQDERGFATALRYPDASLAEDIQRALPLTKVVKALDSVPAHLMADPTSMSAPITTFLAGDDPDAKRLVAVLLTDLGWPRDWIIDLGGVSEARASETLILLVGPLVRSIGPSFAFAVTRERSSPGA